MYKHIDRLDVCLRFGPTEILVGVLASRNRRIFFQYAPEFLAQKMNLSPVRLNLAGHVQSAPLLVILPPYTTNSIH